MAKKTPTAASAERTAPTGTTEPPKPRDKKAADTTKYFARRPFTYAGTPYDREQVLTLSGQPNDERLVRLGYVAELEQTPVSCNRCPAAFRTTGALEQHGKKRHTPTARSRPTMAARQPGESEFDYDRRRAAFERQVLQAEQDEETREESRLDRDAPLNWENTQATRNAEL